MKPGDLVIDKKHNFQHGIIIKAVDTDIFNSQDAIYSVLFAGEPKPCYVLKSNLKKVNV